MLFVYSTTVYKSTTEFRPALTTQSIPSIAPTRARWPSGPLSVAIGARRQARQRRRHVISGFVPCWNRSLPSRTLNPDRHSECTNCHETGKHARQRAGRFRCHRQRPIRRQLAQRPEMSKAASDHLATRSTMGTTGVPFNGNPCRVAKGGSGRSRSHFRRAPHDPLIKPDLSGSEGRLHPQAPPSIEQSTPSPCKSSIQSALGTRSRLFLFVQAGNARRRHA